MHTLGADRREEMADCCPLSFSRGSTEVTASRDTTRREEGKTLAGREEEVVVPGQTNIINHCQNDTGREKEL